MLTLNPFIHAPVSSYICDLERLQRFWLQGACKPKHKKRNVSKPLDVNQFMSAFLLLGCGVLFTILVLMLEHIYFKYIRHHLEKTDKGGYLTLISLSMGKSLSFRGAVQEATDIITHHKCKNPICDTTLRKTRHDLHMAQLKIQELQAMNKMMGITGKTENQDKNIPVAPRPPYWPDLSPCEFFIFRKLKNHFKGQHFGTLENIQSAVTDQLKANPISEFHQCYEEWKKRLQRCVWLQKAVTLKKTMLNCKCIGINK
ncbi:glutamate receptor ionotropic, NMDA 2B [Trichonephila clavipes]|nr:glutamate receptor ionotropic, NMDA 2B [Trichonephila clavipes]